MTDATDDMEDRGIMAGAFCEHGLWPHENCLSCAEDKPSKAKHTPGPWVIGITVDRAHDWPVFRLRSMGTNNPYSEEVQANARLISAAPDLLEACENLVSAALAVGGEGIEEAVILSEAAIAKVKAK